MELNLSKHEIMVLKQLCSGDQLAINLSKTLNINKSFLSRIIKKLEGKDLVIAEKRTKEGRLIKLSGLNHAQSFKRLFESKPNAKIEEWLSGSAMDVLISSSGHEFFDMLASEVSCSKPTLYKVLKKLYGAGVVGRENKKIFITDNTLLEFVSNYADAIVQKTTKKLAFSTIIRIRKHILITTNSSSVPEFFSLTGINWLMQHGLEANPSEYKAYYFNLDGIKRRIDYEEAIAHALILAKESQDTPLLASFIMKNRKLIRSYWLNFVARKFSVEAKMNELLAAIGYYEKLRDLE